MHGYIWYIEQKNKNKLNINFNTLLIMARQINTFHYLDKVQF